jgi:phosphopantothenoylcysteine synthetase/decarboxylase
LAHPRESILLGICGSSAASSIGHLIDLLERFVSPTVTTVCTPAAGKFVNVPAGMYLDDAAWGRDPLHIDLADAAQEFIVCPATVNTIAKAALGIADNLLTTCVLAYRRPIWWVPCANQALWDAEPTQAHVSALRARGHRVVTPRVVPGIGQAGHTVAVGLDWREVIDAVLRAYLDQL